MPERPAPVPLTVLAVAAIAALEAAGLLAYAAYAAVEGFREGFTAPSEVSSVPSRILLVITLAVLGAGMAWVARGWWAARRWARAPFVLAQLLAALIGYELTQAAGSLESNAGWVLLVLGVLGIILSFLPSVSRALAEE